MKRWLLALGLIAVLGVAQAGRRCDEQVPQADRVAQGLALAERTARALDATGGDVALLARAGQDLRQYRLQWSHLAFVYRVAPPTDDAPGTWRVLHKLNHCDSDRAGLFRQGVGDFFLDDPHRFEAAFVVLTPEAASRVRAVLEDPTRLRAWHERRYSVVSYAWGQRYQQSNQWVIETLAGALEPQATTRERAQAWLRLRGYEPTVLRIGAWTRLGGRMSRANVAFDDHPNSERFSDRIATVGADSVLRWAPAAGISGPVLTVR